MSLPTGIPIMKILTGFFTAALLFVLAGVSLAWTTQGWQSGMVISAAYYVEQRQWPAGYGIRLHVPETRTADIHISVEGNRLLIRSEDEKQLTTGGGQGPVFMQFGSFSQWLILPADADMKQMKLTTQEGVISIFIPRKG